MENVRPFFGLECRRLGSKFDGGYVIPLIVLDSSSTMISYGYGNNYDFERDFLNSSPSNECYLFDGSINGARLFFRFLKYLLLVSPRTRSFPVYHLLDILRYFKMLRQPRITYVPKFVSPIKSDKKFIAAEVTIKDYTERSDIILKVDIEGAEYDVLKSIIDNLDNFSCIVVEFHRIDVHIVEFLSILTKIKKHFFIVNTHFNNYTPSNGPIPTTLELVFANNRFYKTDLFMAHRIPSDQDSPCKANRPEIVFSYT